MRDEKPTDTGMTEQQYFEQFSSEETATELDESESTLVHMEDLFPTGIRKLRELVAQYGVSPEELGEFMGWGKRK